MIIPISNDQGGGATEDNTEVGIGVEKPLTGKSTIDDTGLVGAVAGLKMLGTGFEGQDGDAEGQSPTSALETS